MIDWEKIRNMSKEIKIVVDNTWLSPLLFNPFQQGASIVIDSCTKYISGGKCIAGVATFNSENENMFNFCVDLSIVMGLHVSPLHCNIIFKSLNNIEERILIVDKRMNLAIKTLQQETSKKKNFIKKNF